MGTRADFYVGKHEEAEWLGSIAWDGYREGIEDDILNATSEQEFRDAVKAFAATRDDWTSPEQGWPWPWESSYLTDCSYWFFNGQVYDEQHYPAYGHGQVYMPIAVKADEVTGDWPKGDYEKIRFPDMKDRQNVTLGARSGLMIVGLPKE